jgi:hypothetical protein
MIENYRTSSVWNRFMQNTDVQRGLQRAGFLPATGVNPPSMGNPGLVLLQNSPNPFSDKSLVEFSLDRPGRTVLRVLDVTGRELARPIDGVLETGPHRATLRREDLPSGVYFYRLETEGGRLERRCVLVR